MSKYIAILSTWWWHLGTFTQDKHCPFHTQHLHTAVGSTVFPMALPEVQCTGKKKKKKKAAKQMCNAAFTADNFNTFSIIVICDI